MSQSRHFAAVFATLALGAAAPAIADPFTWNPQAVQLAGTKFTADTLVLSDHAQITFGNGGATFVDTGYLPIIGYRLNGQAVQPAGYLAPDGSGWGAYISYTGTGTQVVSPQGVPVAATFQTLSYTIVGYDGLATFGFAPDGSAVVGGGITDVTPLETGSLVSGSLAFVPGAAGPTINGLALATLTELKPQFDQGQPSSLDVNFVHPLGEYYFSSATTLQIAGGSSSSATILSTQGGSGSDQATTGVAVPEPASAALLGTLLGGLAWLRARRRA